MMNPSQLCFFVTRDLDLWHFYSKIYEFLRFYVKFGDPSSIGFWDIDADEQTIIQRRCKPYPRKGRRRGQWWIPTCTSCGTVDEHFVFIDSISRFYGTICTLIIFVHQQVVVVCN